MAVLGFIPYVVSNLAPSKVIDHMAQMLRWAGMEMDAKIWLGNTLLFSWLVGVIVFLSLWVVFEVTDAVVLFASGFAVVVLVFFVFYFLLFIRVEDRRKRVEKVLPDMLQLVAANVRAGVTPVSALRMAARPEFGPLETEIKIATAKSLGTESFTVALTDMGSRIKSDVLERAIGLFTASIRSGGNLAALLEHTSNEILEAHQLRRELVASTSMYTIFLLFALVVGMPLLLSISIQFVTMIEAMQGSLAAMGGGGQFAQDVGLRLQAPVSALFIEKLGIVALLVTAVFTSMLIGVIQDGSEWYGLRYTPLFAIASIAMFYVLRLYVLKMILPI